MTNSISFGFEYYLFKFLSNLPLILILVFITVLLFKFYISAREKMEELSLFNIDLMTPEEKKMYYFTRKNTIINENYFFKADFYANNTSNELYNRDYIYAKPIPKKKTKPRGKLTFDISENKFFD